MEGSCKHNNVGKSTLKKNIIFLITQGLAKDNFNKKNNSKEWSHG